MNNYTGTPGQLKKIAEWMGYDTRILDGGMPWGLVQINPEIIKGYISYKDEYDPAENPAQLLELIKKLLDIDYIIYQGAYFNGNDYGPMYYIELNVDGVDARRISKETLEDAVLAAAWEVCK